MSEQEELKLFDKITAGLKVSYENLLRRKAALGQDMVFADENGQPRVVPAKEALAEYERARKAE
ncbi:MAG: hypothetical protein NC210_05865 [[Clostridium] fimetarium]|nr:hypothetical protein [Alistipes timonensis]MCM1405931.1 hypothetical protein [[Clostridium] fimetarium]